MMLMLATTVAALLTGLAMLLSLYRIVVGPTVPDRMVGVDTLSVALIAMVLILSVRLNSPLYSDAALVVAILSFVGTVAVARFLLRGRVLDDDGGDGLD